MMRRQLLRGERGERRRPIELRRAEERHPDRGERQLGERLGMSGERRLAESCHDGGDIGEAEHGKADTGPPVPNPPEPQRSQPERLLCGD